jgi:insulysin
LGSLWQELLKIHLRELFYEAEVASIYPSVDLVTNGIEYSVSGFSDSIHKFLPDMWAKILEFDLR